MVGLLLKQKSYTFTHCERSSVSVACMVYWTLNLHNVNSMFTPSIFAKRIARFMQGVLTHTIIIYLHSDFCCNCECVCTPCVYVRLPPWVHLQREHSLCARRDVLGWLLFMVTKYPLFRPNALLGKSWRSTILQSSSEPWCFSLCGIFGTERQLCSSN